MKSKQDDDYIKKEDLGIDFKVKYDESCKTCITISTKYTKCITVPKTFYFEIELWKQCDKSYSSCENINIVLNVKLVSIFYIMRKNFLHLDDQEINDGKCTKNEMILIIEASILHMKS